jgi:hypothetical protein
MGDSSECHGVFAQLEDAVPVGTICLGIAVAKVLVGDTEWTFGIAGLVDNSAVVKMLDVGSVSERVELPSSAGTFVDEASSDAAG